MISISRVKHLEKTEVRQVLEIQKECELGRWSESDYQSEPERKDSVFLVAGIERVIVGFLIARVVQNSADKISEASEAPESDLLNFGVLKNYRKQGVGKELFEDLWRKLYKINVRSIWLEVRESNENAVKFYLNRGFEIIQTRKKFYLNPLEDALVLKLEFDKPKAAEISKR